MNYKFKVNDEVTIANPEDGNAGMIGRIVLVDSFDEDDLPYKVHFGDNNYDYDWYSEDDLELVKTAVEPLESSQAMSVSPEVNKAVVDGSGASKQVSEGVKFDSEKLQWWYLWQFLPELEQVAYVLQFGDKKYPAEDGSNWKRLDNLERRASSAAMRHLSAYLQDDKLDNETTKSHLAHCITNLLFLMYNDRNSTKGETK